MRYRPSFDEFVGLARGHSLVPVYRQLVGDTLTPVSAFCKVQVEGSAFLFESVVGGERLGRYSFLGSDPFLTLSAYDRQITLTQGRSTSTSEHADPLRFLENLLAKYNAPHVPGLPRFCGGAVGYAGYDTVRYVERLPHPPADDRGLPDLCFALYDRMVIFDHVNKTILVVAHAHVSDQGVDDLRRAYDAACGKVDRLVERLQQGYAGLQLTDIDADRRSPATLAYKSNFTRVAFEAAVAKAKEYIHAGDIFQVVLSQRLQAETRARPFDIYRTLRVVNPSPFMFYLDAGPLRLVGSSPEIMARVEAGVLTVRPLAGTRPRGRTEDEDQRLAAELVADPKERAEHIMLVDLGRNDVGRVAKFGSVELQDVLSVERYSHVMHLCSSVIGRLLDG
ncbi:MAG TPA: chorismate-binding protein, partial [Mycobacteriales bacterium]|nr:chorismate-binding protein [Mycobacteriales bacterium]